MNPLALNQNYVQFQLKKKTNENVYENVYIKENYGKLCYNSNKSKIQTECRCDKCKLKTNLNVKLLYILGINTKLKAYS